MASDRTDRAKERFAGSGCSAAFDRAKKVIETERGWEGFAREIQKARPATETFTNQALMLIWLALGEEALRKPQNVKAERLAP